jgi:hypothetical protein
MILPNASKGFRRGEVCLEFRVDAVLRVKSRRPPEGGTPNKNHVEMRTRPTSVE